MEKDFIDGTFLITDLMPEGHQRLAMIRDPDTYQKTKADWLTKVRDGAISASMSGLFSVASEVVKKALS